MSDSQIQQAIEGYLSARRELLRVGRKYPERIGGNDNIIGRIGEFIALRFLEARGHRPSKVLDSSNPGFDLVDGVTKTQVKVITAENQKGRSLRLKQPWNQLVLIELGSDYEPVRIGVLTEAQHRFALKLNRGWSRTPVVKLSMLGAKGLIGRYGRVYTADEVSSVSPSLASVFAGRRTQKG